MTKLTLSAEPEVIAEAHRLAEQGRPILINRYPKPDVVRFEKEKMKGNLGLKVPVKLQSSVLFSLLFMLLSAGLLYLYSQKNSVA